MNQYIKIGSVVVFLVIANTSNAAERMLSRTSGQGFGDARQNAQPGQGRLEQENALLRQQLADMNARIARNEAETANVRAEAVKAMQFAKVVDERLDRHAGMSANRAH